MFFQTSVRLAKFWVWWTTARSVGSLVDEDEALSDHEMVVTVHLYNDRVTDYDIKYWLSRFVAVKTPPWFIQNGLGIWTGTRQFRVKEDGTVTHILNGIIIGMDRGQVFYAGQPKICGRWGQLDHLVSGCKEQFCSQCGQLGHLREHWTSQVR